MQMPSILVDRAGRGLWIGAAAVLFLASLALSGAARAADDVKIVDGHKPIAKGEHPRLIYRGDTINAIRAAGKTDWGKGVVYRYEKVTELMGKATLIGRNREILKEAGHKAAGHAIMFVLKGESKYADKAADIVLDEVLGYPMTAKLDVIDRVSRLHGTVIAYDLCHNAWNAPTRDKVAKFLRDEAKGLLEQVGGTGAFQPQSEVHIATVGTVGLVELALLDGASDKAGLERIAACEKAVLRYMNEAVDDHGFGAYGESVKQAAFASGILPFVRANKLVLGRDLTHHPAIKNTLTPMVYMAVPGAGMPVMGQQTIAIDRSGLFAMATDLASKEKRPGIVWMFKQLGGDSYRGVVRPFHALYMLQSDMHEYQAAAPSGDAWPRMYHNTSSQMVIYRSKWQDASDFVFVLQSGHLRMLGHGSRWASFAGPHAAMWSDSPGAGRIDNMFMFQSQMVKKTTTHRASAKTQLKGVEADAESGTMSIHSLISGEVQRTKKEIKEKKRKNDKRVEETTEVPEGGPYTGSRIVGVDYSGKSGVPVLIVVADELNGADAVEREWVLHLGFSPASTQDQWDRRVPSHWTLGDSFIKQSGQLPYYDAPDLKPEDAKDKKPDELPAVKPIFGDKIVTMRGQVIAPKGVKVAGTSNAPHANFIHAPTMSRTIHVIITIGPGKPPKIEAGDKGLNDKVRVGNRSIQLVDGKIVFSD